MARVLIIGAGISGLAAAHRLRRAGCDVKVIEATSEVGGAISTERDGEWLFERGPNSFLDNEPATLELCRELKLENRLLKTSLKGSKRFIFLNDALHEAPSGPGALYKTPLLSASAKRGLFLEPLRGANRSREDESLADFVRRRLGDEVLDHMVTPFVSGVYAGDPEKLSLRASFEILYDLERDHGSLLLGGLSRAFGNKKTDGKPKKPRSKNLCSFIDGMQELPAAIAAELGEAVRLNSPVQGVERDAGRWRVHIESGDSEEGDALIVTAPAYISAEWLSSFIPDGAAYLKSIPYNKLCVMAMGYRREDVEHSCDGFGFLVPRRQSIRFLGSIWSSSLFAIRAPGGHHTLTCFIGGGLDSQAYDMSDDELRGTVMRDLHVSLGARGEPAAERLIRWEKAIPQYPIGHVDAVERLQSEMHESPGLYLTGNFMRGVSVNDCIRNARETADRAAEFAATAKETSA